MTVQFYQPSVDNESTCDACSSDLEEGAKVYCEDCYGEVPTTPTWNQWLRDLEADLSRAGAPARVLQNITKRREDCT